MVQRDVRKISELNALQVALTGVESILIIKDIDQDGAFETYRVPLSTLAEFFGTEGNGVDGKSAYEIAVDNGFVGTEPQWLESLRGAPGLGGFSAFEIAVANGFVGTPEDWLESLVGPVGPDGRSAYQVAIDNGTASFPGTELDWLESLVGPQGIQGPAGQTAYEVAAANGFSGDVVAWLASLVGPQGAQGLSAYQVAVANGFVGTLSEWLASLVGPQGPPGEGGSPAVPENTVTPTIAGIGTVDETLTVVFNGTWSGSPTSFDYQWTVNDVPVSGEDEITHIIAAIEAGEDVAVEVIANNATGPSLPAKSNIIVPNPALSITMTPDLEVTVGDVYEEIPVITGGRGPYTLSLQAGSLSGTGLTLSSNPSIGLAGTLLTAGTISGLVVRATDQDGLTDDFAIGDIVVQSGFMPRQAVSFEVLGASEVDNVVVNGWAAMIEFDGMIVGGVTDVATVGKEVVLSVERTTGFTADGVPHKWIDEIRARIALRKPAPLAASKIQQTSGSNVKVAVTLSKRLYIGDVILAVGVGAAVYVQGANSSAATANIPTRINNSAVPYPIPVRGFTNAQCMKPTGSNFRVGTAPTHPLARNGQQVACVEFRVIDVATSTDQGISVKVNTPTISTILTEGMPVEGFEGDIPMAGLTQGVDYEVYDITYPFVGDAYSSLGFTGTLTHARSVTRLRFTCDKNGTFGKVAYVRAGGTATGTTGIGDPTKPYSNPSTAATALGAAHASQSGNDAHSNADGGTIYIQEATPGAGVNWGGVGASMTTQRTGARTWLYIKPDPAATGPMKFVTGSSKNPNNMCCFEGWIFDQATVLGNVNDEIILSLGGTNRSLLWLNHCSYSRAAISAQSAFHGFGMSYVTNCTFDNTGGNLFNPVGNVSTQFPLIGGNACNNVNAAIKGFVVLGNIFLGASNFTEVPASATAMDDNDFFLYGWNYATKLTGTSTQGGRARTAGAFVSNLMEHTFTNPVIWAGDGTNVNVDNFISWHNTVVGVRWNALYTASGVSVEDLKKNAWGGYDLLHTRNTKSDEFWVSEGGTGHGDGNDQTGNWAYRHHVDISGTVITNGQDNGSGPGTAGWHGEFTMPDGTFDVAGKRLYVNNKAAITGDGLGNGDYHLWEDPVTPNDNPAYNRVPAGKGVLKYDMDGNLRLQNGQGAAGIFERTDL